MKKEITYEQAYQELNAIVSDMENEEIPVDKLSLKIKRAAELINLCKQKLLATEEEVDNALKDFGA